MILQRIFDRFLGLRPHEVEHVLHREIKLLAVELRVAHRASERDPSKGAALALKILLTSASNIASVAAKDDPRFRDLTLLLRQAPSKTPRP